MSKTVIQNPSASVRQKLLNLARSTQRPFSELLQYFVIERFIHRLSISPYRDNFILKGALMFNVWKLADSRATKDVDLLGITENNTKNIQNVIRKICQISFPDDGVTFIWKDIECKQIQERNEYAGVRALLFAELSQAKIKLQIDIGFGDIVHPKPINFQYPTLLKMDPPNIRGYTSETVIAEKLHTMIRQGLTNSRMKDIFDIWLLSRQFSFDGKQLSQAVKKTFSQRNMIFNGNEQFIFSHEYKNDNTKKRQWDAFVTKSKVPIFPNNFAEAIEHIQLFTEPLVQSNANEWLFDMNWEPPGPWK